MSEQAIHPHSTFDDSVYQRAFTAHVVAISEQSVALDYTLFYPTGGGQPGDTGHLILPDGSSIDVIGTLRDPLQPELIWHQLGADPGFISTGFELQGRIDWERRYQHMKMHTCLHLLCSIIDAPVTGCGIDHEKGRLDFDLPEMTLDKEAITRELNVLVNAGLEVRPRLMQASEYATIPVITRAEAVAPPMRQGTVRVIEIQGGKIQPCGGTHVRNTREIGRVYCDKIKKKSKHNRRVTLRFF